MSPVGALYDTFTKANGHPSSLKLRFDSSLIDDGPCRFDFALVELVEHVLRKGYLAPINLKAEKTSLGRAVKFQAARDVRRLAGQEVNVEMKVRDFTKIPPQHYRDNQTIRSVRRCSALRHERIVPAQPNPAC